MVTKKRPSTQINRASESGSRLGQIETFMAGHHSLEEIFTRDRRVAQAFFTTPVLTPGIEKRIPLLEFTAEDWNEGAPRVGLTRGGLSYAERFEALLRPRPSPLPHV